MNADLISSPLDFVRRFLSHELKAHPSAAIWPVASEDIPDETLLFRIAWLGLEWGILDAENLRRNLDDLHRHWGQTRRQFRNALAFVVPDRNGTKRALDLAEIILSGTNERKFRAFLQPGLLKDKIAEIRAVVFSIYRTIHLPRHGQEYLGETQFDVLPFALDPHSEKDLLEAAMRTLEPHFRSEIAPSELKSILGLGEVDCAGVRRLLFPMSDAARWFFCFLNLPRFRDVQPILQSIRQGIRAGEFGLLRSSELLRLDELESELRAKVLRNVDLPLSDLSLESGSYLVWSGALD